MSFPLSAEGVTRYLRSKTTTTSQVYDVSKNLLANKYDFYFPQGHIFLMDLLVDRWNDIRSDTFRKDCNIWALWQILWEKIETDDHRKKLLKNLKLTQLVQLTLEPMTGDDAQLFRDLYQVVKKVNSCTSTAITPELSVKILGGVIDKALLFNLPKDEADQIIREYLILTDLTNVHEFTKKIPTIYCSNLLLPSLKYLVRMEVGFQNNIGDMLSSLLQKILFESRVNIIKTFSDFLNEAKQELNVRLELELFKKCVHNFSKGNSKELEDIFKLIINVDPQSCSVILEALHSSKRSISQEFLESLFDQAYKNKDFIIMKRTLELDIEVGIINHERLLSFIEQTSDDEALPLWNVLINCYVNAREFLTFLEVWETYCRRLPSSKMVTKTSFRAVVARNIQVLSKTQKHQILKKFLELVTSSKDLIAVKILQVIVLGLKNLSYKEASEFKLQLSEIFKLMSFNEPEFWKLQYHVLEIFEDIILTTNVEDSVFERLLHLDTREYSLDLYFTIFKFRELKDFDIKPLTKSFTKFIENDIHGNELTEAIFQVFDRWPTLVNLLFDQEDIRTLISILLEQSSELVQKILRNEDFFEESRIIHEFVSSTLKGPITDKNADYLVQFPIQCISKTARVFIIDSVVSKSEMYSKDITLLSHVLKNPTFRSKLETDYETLLNFVQDPIFDGEFENKIIDLIWGNYVSQISDKKCAEFVNFIASKLNSDLGDGFNQNTYMLAHFITKNTKVTVPSIDALRETLIRNIRKSLETFSNENISSWSMNLLFVQMSSLNEVYPSGLLLDSYRTSSDVEVKSSYFLLYCLEYKDKIEYLLAQYLLLRELGTCNKMLLDAVNAVVERKIQPGYEEFNSAFLVVVETLPELSWKNSSHILELYQMFVRYLAKDNEEGRAIFVRSISNILTFYSSKNVSNQDTVEMILFMRDLLVTKPYLFSQYCLEMLFPLTAKVGIDLVGFVGSDGEKILTPDKNKVYIALTQLISSILLYHRYRLSDRHHLVNSIICILLELLAQYKQDTSSLDSVRSLSRLICNFCEPSNIKGDKRDSLNSAVSIVKRSLRKHVPILLLKIISISLLHPAYSSMKTELRLSTDSIFNLLSDSELNLVNANLDNSGRIYFKTLYADYKNLGKWHDD